MNVCDAFRTLGDVSAGASIYICVGSIPMQSDDDDDDDAVVSFFDTRSFLEHTYFHNVVRGMKHERV